MGSFFLILTAIMGVTSMRRWITVLESLWNSSNAQMECSLKKVQMWLCDKFNEVCLFVAAKHSDAPTACTFMRGSAVRRMAAEVRQDCMETHFAELT